MIGVFYWTQSTSCWLLSHSCSDDFVFDCFSLCTDYKTLYSRMLYTLYRKCLFPIQILDLFSVILLCVGDNFMQRITELIDLTRYWIFMQET